MDGSVSANASTAYPLVSMRANTAPTKPRRTASGLIKMRVRSWRTVFVGAATVATIRSVVDRPVVDGCVMSP